MNHTPVTSVGIDVSKRDLTVALVSEHDAPHIKTVSNSERGVAALLALLNKHGTAVTVPCVIESTGDYHLRSALMLAEAGYTVNVINPIITKQYQRTSIRNSKDDSVDAVRLANIGLREPNLLSFDATKEQIALKKLVASIGKLEQCKQKLTAHLKQLETTTEFLGVPANTVTLRQGIAALDAQIATFEKATCVQASPDAKRIATSVRGVSQTSVAKLLTLLDGHTFSDRDKLVAFCGLDVAPRRSGSWRGNEHLSKRGNPHLRKILFQMAWGLKQHNPAYRTYYDRLRLDHKHYFTCLIAIARKFLRFLYADLYKNPIG